MNNKILHAFVVLLSLFYGTELLAQHKCGQVDIYNFPGKEQKILEHEEQIANWISARQAYRNTGQPALITIPVVVHVIHNGEAIGTGANISEAQIIEQIEILNTDFRALNADSLSPGHPFYDLRGDSRIEFCLAKQDPYGYMSNGITRTLGGQTGFDVGDSEKIKSTEKGGKDNWDPQKYLNIWIFNPTVSNTFIGWATPPVQMTFIPEWDGVVIQNTAFGINANNLANYNLGRTLTHEVGHWLDLLHPWGDHPVFGCLTDNVDDTPPSEGPNYGCPGFPVRPNNVCSSDANGEMFMNFMDYANHACMNMFTEGQALRMQATINTIRESLLASTGCQPSALVNPLAEVSKWFVDPAATGNSDGTSWANAIPSLQQALSYALDYGVGEIWVKKGTYIPAGDGNRWAAFEIPNGVKVYGGFAGTETLLTDRNMALIHTTGASVLDGDLSGNDSGLTNNGENSYTVVRFSFSSNTTGLDGFVIRGGNNYFASGAGWGGGISNQGFGETNSSQPKLANCLVKDNYAYMGGGLYNHGGDRGNTSMIISDCIFENNSSDILGGALYNNAYEEGTCSPVITNTVFKNNFSRFGGAVYNDGSYAGNCQPVFTNCTFEGNLAQSGNGGAINNDGRGDQDQISGLSSPVFVNCLFKNNRADGTGGALYNDGDGNGESSPIFKNTVFVGNESFNDGSIMHTVSSMGGEALPEFTNCSFSGNKTTFSVAGGFYNYGEGNSTQVNFTNCAFFDNGAVVFRKGDPAAIFTLNHCLVEATMSGFTGSNNLFSAVSPFVSATDLHLSNCSPAKNIGNNAATGLSGISADLDGNARIQETTIDAGAYEAPLAPVVSMDETRGKALSFSGNTQYVSTVNILSDAVNNLTLEGWVKITAFPATDTIIFYQGNDTLNGYGLKLDNSGNLEIVYGGISSQATTHTFTLNSWQHIALRTDNTATEVFVNGKSVGTLSGLPTAPTGAFIMGGFKGQLDELRFWESALTQTQIRENMHLIVDGSSSGLSNYFQFNETAGTTVLKDGVGCAKAIVHNATWVESQANFSQGTSFTVNNPATATDYDFTGTNLSLNFGNTPGAGQIIVSRLEGKPTGTQVSATFAFNDYYWVVDNYCANTTNLDIDAQVTMAANLLVAADESNPSQVKLNRRVINSGGNWTTVEDADLATVSTNKLLFESSSELLEFVISNSYNAILFSEDTLSAFSICAGLISNEQSYTASATDLTADLVITAPSGYEISLTSGTGFSSSLNLVPSTGTVSSTTIYVRKNASASDGLASAIIHSSNGQLTKELVIPADIVNQLGITLAPAFVTYTNSASFNLVFQTGYCLPTTYSVTAIAPNPLSGFTAINNATMTSSPIAVPLPGSLQVGTYTFNLQISNGVSQVSYPFTLNIVDQALTERRGKAMYFNGSGQNLVTERTLSPTVKNTTMEAWVNVHSVPSYGEFSIMHHGSKDDGFGVVLMSSRHLLIAFNMVNRYATNYYLPVNGWNHIALVNDGTFVYLYVNGELIYYMSDQSVAPTEGLVLGGRLTQYFNGELDEVRYWNVGRTQQQIRESMHLTLPAGTSGLQNYYQFNEATPQATAMDVISGINATVNGASWTDSKANVSKGVSYTINDPAAGVDHTFTGTSLQLNFGNPVGTGAVVVSRLEGEPAGTPMTSSEAVDQYYWVADNFGQNKTGLNITAKITLPGGEVTATNESVPGTMLLNQRDVNATGNWELAKEAVSVVSSTGVVTFTANSNIREFVVGKSTLLLPTVSISCNDPDNNIPAGSLITFTAVTTNTGDTPTFQWKVNGVNAGTNSATFSTDALQANDVVSVVFSTTGSGISTLGITSNLITIKVYSFEVEVKATDAAICEGESTTLSVRALANGYPLENLWTAKPVNFNSGIGIGNNTTWLTKVYVDSAVTVSQLWVEITNSPPGTTHVKLALYSDAGGVPRNRIVVSDPKNNLQPGINKVSIASTVLTPGAYWVGFMTDNSINFRTNTTLSGNNAAVLFTGYSNGFPATTFTSTIPNAAYSFGIVGPPPTFTWSPSGTLNASVQDTVNAAPLVTTTYTAGMTDAYGNTRTGNKQIYVAGISGTQTVSACGSYLWIDGNTYTANNNSATHILPNSLGCDSTVTLNLTINAIPVADDPADVAACDSYTLPALITGNYFTGPGGTGTALSAGNVITSSQQLYVYAQTGTSPDCTDENSFMVTITPTPTITGTVSASRCGTGAITLEATPSAGVINWFLASTGGTTGYTGNVINLNLSSSKTYYVEASHSGCISASRTAVTATIDFCSQIQASQCGTTLATVTTPIIADAALGATHYRFEINGGAQVITKTTRTLYLANFAYDYGTTYAVRVATSSDGTNFGSYGSSCNVSSPSIPVTQVQASQCGTTLANVSTAVIADAVTGATHYRFEINGGAQVITKTTRTLYVGNFTYAYGATYAVRVSASPDGTNFGTYGTSCNITAPPAPTTQVQASQCGTTLATVSTAIIADAMSGATHYRFEINGGAQYVTKTTRTLYLGNFTYALNTTYAIKVAYSLDGGSTYQPYGAGCNITSPSSGMKQGDADELTEDLVGDMSLEVFPNPNSGDFTITSTHEGTFNLVNELGQVIHTIEITKENNYQVQAGLRYASGPLHPGVYFITGTINNAIITKKVMVVR